MKFSILISSYNKGKFIKECINSCLNQKEKDYEIILYDNYSNDNTNEILEIFKNNNKLKIFKKKRISKFAALNQIDLIKNAFKKSKGNIICLLDADDIIDKNKLITLKKNYIKKQSIESIFDLPIINKSNSFKKFKLKTKFQNNIWPTIIPTSSISCRRPLFIDFLKSSFLTKFKNLEIDFRFNVYIRNLNKKHLILKNDITYYRQVKDGIMSNTKKFSKNWWNKRLEAHEYMKKLLKKNNINYDNKIDYFLSNLMSRLN